jgi:hypothetical protein
MSSGGGRPGGMSSGGGKPNVGNASMSGMGGGGGRPDPDKPFASERNKKALDDLIADLGKPGKK